ncbi:lectin subunit alpha-like [Armigeres subalbatus]|uniref:lectin subunit alpha-like n=1 Tax=Armigeres subalbatus TaxID=124917 RepID=UPI002ED39A94
MAYKLCLTLLFTILTICKSNCKELVCESPPKYYIPNAKINWIGAVEYCNRLNMRLAIVDSEAKHNTIVELIKRSVAYNANGTNVWIGANDISEEGTFIWHDTGLKVDYKNWSVGNPDNHIEEDCVEIAFRSYTKWTWTWNDNKCHVLLNFICEFW